MKEYALYKGEELICMGTAEHIAEVTGVKVSSIEWMRTPTYKKRAGDNAKVLVELN
ncbi:hypothetical protein [Periweissella fabalis]|uniref:Uncharacterized protein n=1 Tax=Periweissella fabalis TaxID=1070421 RepID=A0A7X6N2H5_9LACO|nr:hypothetical protein [Periweissella fabalis]MCM0599208.1 hypothetical protein [Periweissella fabalis]NKZ23487.1 hypothetical protein [Periweissella fabalis]